MSSGSTIQWTEATWNPVTGCTRVSAGCDHCYAVGMTHRLASMGQQEKYGGLTVLNGKGDRHFNGTVRTHDEALSIPLSWKKPRRIFVNSMSDLFHPGVPFEFIDKVFAVMALCPQHTFQVLTKRPERMAEYLRYAVEMDNFQEALDRLTLEVEGEPFAYRQVAEGEWPIENVWLGTSAENQAAFDERVSWLRRCPAAVRFLSLEPLLGAIELEPVVNACPACGGLDMESTEDAIWCEQCGFKFPCGDDGRIHWVIVGGESGKGARPCEVAWIRSIIDQCRAAGVPVFYKQGGASNRCEHDAKGGCFQCFPDDMKIREFPDAIR